MINIRPTEDWYWYFDEKLDTLMIDLSHDMVFRSRLSKKMIVSDALKRTEFSVQDASLFYQFCESCDLLALSEPNKVELVLNALAAKNYLKPLMPKSWYFITQPDSLQPKIGEMVSAYLQESGKPVSLLTIDVGDNASLCVIAQLVVTVSDKTFYLGDAIKVMNNRLTSHNWSSQDRDNYLDVDDEALRQFLNKVC